MAMPSMIRKIEPGDVIGRCRIIRELGRGGVGTVYLATHQTLQIEVALKVLSPALSMDDPALAERFIREAQLAARIRHPNVIAVMDAAHDESTGLYFIVQEFVGGGSLSWHLRNGPLPERKALAIVTDIAQALIVAEENRIVHRDIKPDNIMLDLRGTAKLADLGLAKHAIDSHLTLTLGGSFMGTPAYMSPEQARDAKVADTRDDIYSLGATFYECLTGEPPFRGETPYNIMSELLTKPSPKPRAHRPELSRSVDLVCRKMMAKTRGLRYADARVLMEDLHHCAVVTDAGIDGLHACTFEQDSIMARQQAFDFGVVPATDGAAPAPGRSALGREGKSGQPVPVPVRRDSSAFRAAALLLALVISATVLLIWMSPQRLWTSMRHHFALLSPAATATSPSAPVAPENKTPPAPAKPVPKKETPASSHAETPPNDAPPSLTKEENATTPTSPPPIAALSAPAGPTPLLPPVPGTVPALPVDPNAPAVTGVPAVTTTADDAFQARDVAEASLPPGLVGPDGHADLLRIRGKRTDGQLVPATWTFEFFNPKAAGHALIASIRNHRVVDNGERWTYIISPYTHANILPDGIIDSSQALQIAQQLIPTLPVSSAEFVLEREKNSAPFWTVTLWAKNPHGDEIELGDVVILADKGDVISNTLKPDRVKD
jgi:serine/threonine protein kinase